MNLVAIGIGVILLGFLLVFIGSVSNSDVKSSGGVFIGPFPLFGFGDKKVFYVLWGIAIALFIAFSLFR